MYLHIGGDCVIFLKDVIAIVDLESTSCSKSTREFLKISEEEGFIKSISNELPKSYIITETGGKIKIYLSPISSITLQRRTKFMKRLANIK